MGEKAQPGILPYAFWLSLLGHLCFFGSFIVYLEWHPVKPPPLPSAVASYAVPAMALPPSPAVSTKALKLDPQKMETKALKKTKDIVEKPVKAETQVKTAPPEKTKEIKRAPQFSKASPSIDLTNPYDREPLHLIGESKIVPPLVRILAQAIGRHLYYPRVAAEFNLRGTVLVGFVLHPEGYITNVRVFKSSDAGVLDDAARDSVAAVATVGQVSEYVDKPEFLVIGIIFG